jgi:tRNA G18 (ribose-2'-O)-methylase SpoU
MAQNNPFIDYSKKIAETVKDENFWNVHDRYKDRNLDELSLIQSQASLPFAVCILNLTGDLNVGMIVRTACTMGASEVILFGRRKYDKRSTVGAQNYMPIARHNGFRGDGETLDINLFHQLMADRGYLPIFVEQGGTPIETMNWGAFLAHDGRTPCLIFGNESEGIPPEMMVGELVVSISQRGVLRSLNVSAAASIVIHDLASHLANHGK